MNTQKYNGWTNYETWLVKLWIDKDEGSQNFWADRAREVFADSDADGTFTKAENAALSLDDELKEWHEQIAEESGVPTTGFIADLFGAAMSEVNWHEIATSLIEDACEDEIEAEETA